MANQPGETEPTIVLLHGAWADASDFAGVIRALEDRGFRAVGFANPLRGLADDAKYLADYLGTLSGPSVLVGHSYGGADISSAAVGNEQRPDRSEDQDLDADSFGAAFAADLDRDAAEVMAATQLTATPAMA